jgi:signal transduction histidine kinase
MKHAEKVLFVDDEPRVLSALRRRLAGRFAVEVASSPLEALNTLESTSGIAVVVADMRMPEMSGIELLGRIRSRWPEIRRIMLTGNTDQETALAAVNDGHVFRFFNKPVDADLLAEALEAAIEEYRFTTDAAAQIERLHAMAASGDRTRRSFLAMMNHELRTPLNHILGFAALLEQRCKQKGELDSLEYVSYIRESGQSLLHVLNRIMEVVRLTAGEVRPGETVLDVIELLQQEVAHYRPLAAERHITIGFTPPAEPLWVMGGAHELSQAFAELLDNAIKFNRTGGHVAIAVSWAGSDIAVRIADSGIGMSDVNRVLDAFSQREDGLNRRFEGIGIGLTLAALTAQAYGGNLSIESRPEHGTVVMMRLERAVGATQAVRIA